MKLDRSILLAVLLAFAIGFYVSSSRTPPTPELNRPVLSWIKRAARTLLWVTAFAEPAPQPQSRQYIVRSHVGSDGFATIDHGRGW